jgi:hypothetical protein
MISLSLSFPIYPPTQLSESYWERQLTLSTVQSAAAATTTGWARPWLPAAVGVCNTHSTQTSLSLSLFRVAGIVVPRAQKQSENTPIPFVPFAFSMRPSSFSSLVLSLLYRVYIAYYY